MWFEGGLVKVKNVRYNRLDCNLYMAVPLAGNGIVYLKCRSIQSTVINDGLIYFVDKKGSSEQSVWVLSTLYCTRFLHQRQSLDDLNISLVDDLCMFLFSKVFLLEITT